MLHARRLRRSVHDPLSPAPAARAAARAGDARLGARRSPRRERALAKRHYKIVELARRRAARRSTRASPLLFNDDLIAGVAFPTAADPVYIANGDADSCVYIHQGGGTLRTLLGDLAFAQGDYVFVPARPAPSLPPRRPAAALAVVLARPAASTCPKQWRNEVGQLRMDAPYSHRDFKRPQFTGPLDEGIRELVVRRARRVARLHARALAARRRRLGRHRLSVGVPDPELPAARVSRCTCRRRGTARSPRAAR